MHRCRFLMRAWLLAGLVLAVPASAQSNTMGVARWDTATFWSQSLGVRKRMLVRLPASYDRSTSRRYPVLYYLHGHTGDEEGFARSRMLEPALDSLAAAGREVLVVAPDGDDGWYTTWNSLGDWPGCRRDFQPRDGRHDTVDSYCVPWPHYDDYIARDLVAYVDRTWRSDTRREQRAIAGISMGGYGALVLALQYPEVFSAAASHSGVVSPLHVGPQPFAAPPVYATTIGQLQQAYGTFFKALGPAFGPDTAGWWSRDPGRKARALWRTRRKLMPAIHLDIGTEDEGLIEQNRALRFELNALGIPFTYREWPGGHDIDYWRAHVGEGLRFVVERISR